MKWFLLFLVFDAVFCTNVLELTSQEIIRIVERYNSARSNVEPSASSMQPLIWNEVLATAARDNTMNCDVNPFRVPVTAPGFDSIGVVAAVTSSRTPDFGALIDFRARGINYNYTTNMCTSVGACNDFWVLTRANATMVGCGATFCDRVTGFPIPGSINFICYLSPTTEVPLSVRAYSEGEPCSNCRGDQLHCNENLCASCPVNTFYLAENETCVDECPDFLYGDVSARHCSPFVEDYIVVANATSYSVTMVTASSSGSVDIPFTVTFQLQHYNETFFRPTGHILLTVNISTNSEDNDTAVFHFDDDTVARVHTSAANNGFTFLDHINAGDTLVLQDIIIFSFDLSTRVTEPRTFNFFTELYSGDCIDCVGSGVITVDRTPLFQGAVTLIPPGVVTLVETTPMEGAVCPGDLISYSCVIESHSPELTLTWHVSSPTGPPAAITYTSVSNINVSTPLNANIDTVFHGYNNSDLRSVESTLIFTVPDSISEYNLVLECSFTDQSSASLQQLFNDSYLPQTASNFHVINLDRSESNITLVLDWDEPLGDVDYYNLSISPSLFSDSMFMEVLIPPWEIALDVSMELYTAGVSTVNCYGESVPQYLIIDFTTNITVIRNQDSAITCPGDITTHTCSIQSYGAANLELTWLVRFPDFGTITISYTNSSSLNTSSTMDTNITATLTEFDEENFFIQSVIMLPDAGTAALRSNTELECLFRGNESNRSVVVAAYSDPVLPLMPSNPQVIIHHDVRNVVITLAWEAPRGEGPEAVVDHYIISLSPSPLSPMDTMVLASPWNVTLNSNEVLTATIVAVNCNGESDPLVFDVITGPSGRGKYLPLIIGLPTTVAMVLILAISIAVIHEIAYKLKLKRSNKPKGSVISNVEPPS